MSLKFITNKQVWGISRLKITLVYSGMRGVFNDLRAILGAGGKVESE